MRTTTANRSTKGRALAALAAAIVLLAGCGGAPPRVSPDGTRILDSTATFTAPTLRDWKDVGDAIVAVEVTGERQDPATATGPNGVYGRLVDVSVLHVYWQRGSGTAPPGNFTMRAWGWLLDGNSMQPFVVRGEPRLDVNHVYLLAMAHFATGWAGLGSGAEVPFDGGIVGHGEWEGRDPKLGQPALAELLGKDAAQVQAIIDATQADPRAAAYDELDPLGRARKLGLTSAK